MLSTETALVRVRGRGGAQRVIDPQRSAADARDMRRKPIPHHRPARRVFIDRSGGDRTVSKRGAQVAALDLAREEPGPSDARRDLALLLARMAIGKGRA